MLSWVFKSGGASKDDGFTYTYNISGLAAAAKSDDTGATDTDSKKSAARKKAEEAGAEAACFHACGFCDSMLLWFPGQVAKYGHLACVKTLLEADKVCALFISCFQPTLLAIKLSSRNYGGACVTLYSCA